MATDKKQSLNSIPGRQDYNLEVNLFVLFLRVFSENVGVSV